MEGIVIDGLVSAVGALLGAFVAGLGLGIKLQQKLNALKEAVADTKHQLAKQFNEQLADTKDQIVQQFNEQLADTKHQLAKQFNEQLAKSENAFMEELKTAKSEWLREIGVLRQEQEVTSDRLEKNEAATKRVTHALAVILQQTAKRMGESGDDFRRAAEDLMQSPQD